MSKVKLQIIICILFIFNFSKIKAENSLRKDENGFFNAQLENVTLYEIKEFFEKNYQIKFNGPDFIFQTKITASINNLNIDQFIKRVLKNKNYALMFDIDGKLSEVTLVPGDRDTNQFVNTNISKDSQSNSDQFNGKLRFENSKYEDINDFKQLKNDNKKFETKIIKDDPNFKVEINRPPYERMK